MASIWAGFSVGGGSSGGGGGPNPNIQIPGMQQTVDQLNRLNTAVGDLTTALSNLAGQQQQLGQNIGRMFGQIGNQANQAAGQVNNLNSATQSAVQNTTGGGGISKLFGVASAAAGSDVLKDLAMFPLRFITQTIETNRQLSMNMQSVLSGQMYAQQGLGASPASFANGLARFPGNVQGSAEDLISLMGAARSAGAMFIPGTPRASNNRTTGFLNAVQQMQAITPATPAGAMAGAVAQQLSPQAQQSAAYLTGGAFAMLGAGGKVKNLQEWAEGILRWIEGMRPPPDTGKPFDYGQLMAQYFPGSNIDAWMSVNGITNDMKEYWWNYALGKASKTNSTQGAFTIRPIGSGAGNQPWERLQAVSAKGRGELQLAGAMSGSYANKESSNRWFADLMGQIQREVIPRQTARGGLASLQYMPDTLQELLMGFLERSGPVGALIGGGIGYGITGGQSLLKNLMGFATDGVNSITDADMSGLMELIGGGFRAGGGVVDAISQLVGDAPDIGDNGMEHGMHGATSTAGLHPDMKRKVGAMMRANPKLRINSGLRDTYTQQNLKNKGYSNVSGKPSAHTRGLAADLGPSSQYKWIARNAKRFGLSSGKSFGEPWHVGIGDIGAGIGDDGLSDDDFESAISAARAGRDSGGDPATLFATWSQGMSASQKAQLRRELGLVAGGGTVSTAGGPNPTDPFTDYTVQQMAAAAASQNSTATTGQQGIGRLFNLFSTGIDRDSTVDAIGKLVPSIMTLFLGTFGMGGTSDTSQLQFYPGLYDQLVKAGGGVGGGTLQFGGLQPSGKTSSFDYGKSLSFTKAGATNTGAGSDATSTGTTDLAAALTALGMKVAPGASAGAMVAHLAHAAGFSNSMIPTVVGIAERESKFKPTAHNTNANTGDNSYGLTQINMLGSLGPARQQQFGISSYDELFDPYVNLKAMYTMSGGTNFHPWLGYRPGLALSEDRKERALQYTKEAGYGDMPDFNTLSMLSDTGSGGGAGGGGMVFHNQFIINAQGGSPTSGGFDVRRAVTQMADQLEAEMSNRSMRHN